MFVVNPLVGRLAVNDALPQRLLASSSPDPGSVDDVALFGLVTHGVRLVRARWPLNSNDRSLLSVLPRADSEKKSHNI